MVKLVLFALFALFAIGCESRGAPRKEHCNACNNLVSFSQRLTTGLGESDLRTVFVKWCENSGNNANHAVCLYLVNDLMSTLKRFKFETFCKQANACPTSPDTPLLATPSVSTDNVTCTFCVNTLTHIKGIVASKETEDEFKLVLSQVCEYFGSFRNECVKMLDQNLDDIFSYLRDVMQPEEFCKEMGFCTSVGKTSQSGKPLPEIEEVINLYPVDSFDAPIKVDMKDRTIKAMAKPYVSSVTFGPECFACKKIFEYVYSYTSKYENKTEEVIREALDKVCDEVFGSKKETCERIVNKYVHDIIYYVQMATEPDIACTLLGLCIGSEPLIFHPVDNPECVFCKQIMTWVFQELKDNKTQEAIKDALDRVCEEVMPSSKVQQCKAFVDQYLNEIINAIIQSETPEEACKMLSFCNTAIPFVKIQKTATKVKGADCILCKEIMTWVFRELRDNKTEESIKEALDKVCEEVMPASKVDRCEAFVNQYIQEIIDVILITTKPEDACKALRFCGAKAKEAKLTVKPDCILCKEIMTWVYKYLQDNRTEEAIKQALDKVCEEIMPASKVEKCEALVNQYVEQIINVIVIATNPDEACQLLGFCDRVQVLPFVKIRKTATKVQFVPLMKLTPAMKVGEHPFVGALCDVCRRVFSWLNGEVSNPKLKSDVIRALDVVCDVVFLEDRRAECKAFVEKYTDEIVEVISNETNPDVACVVLRVCKYNKDLNRIQLNPQREIEGNGVQVGRMSPRTEFCYVCQLSAHFIQEELYDVQTEQQINNFIEKELCNRLAHAVERKMCDSYVNEYAASIEQLIAQRIFDPTEICEKFLRICPPSKPGKHPKLEFELLSKEKVCQVCVKAVDRLDDVKDSVDWQPIDRNISLIARTVCKAFDESEITECLKIIETYGLEFINSYKDLTDSRKVCKSVDLCFIAGEVHLLGGHKCSFGPAYWCHTIAHADACKATEYCKHKIWKAIN